MSDLAVLDRLERIHRTLLIMLGMLAFLTGTVFGALVVTPLLLAILQ